MPREVVRSDKYTCPVCGDGYGELMNTKRLANHLAPGGDGYTLCRGSRTVLSKLAPGPQGASGRRSGRASARGRAARPDPRIGPGQDALFGLDEACGEADPG